jgi:hypothetical protein
MPQTVSHILWLGNRTQEAHIYNYAVGFDNVVYRYRERWWGLWYEFLCSDLSKRVMSETWKCLGYGDGIIERFSHLLKKQEGLKIYIWKAKEELQIVDSVYEIHRHSQTIHLCRKNIELANASSRGWENPEPLRGYRTWELCKVSPVVPARDSTFAWNLPLCLRKLHEW